MRAQKLIKALYKIHTFTVLENMEGIDPSARLCCCCSVVRIGGVFERNIGMKIRNTKLLEVRHVVRKRETEIGREVYQKKQKAEDGLLR